MIQLTDDQHRALEADGEPARVTDPVTKQEYVLIKAEIYERFCRPFDDDVRLMEPLLAELSPEDWDDPSAYEKQP